MDTDMNTNELREDIESIEDGSAADTPQAPAEVDADGDGPDEHEALLARLRAAMLASDPTVDPELVGGSTVYELEESFERARAVTERLREVIRARDAVHIPAGAPGRMAPAPTTAFEKIRSGLEHGRS